MKNNTGKIVRYPVDAQSNLFLCAVTSVLLAANADRNLQFYCAQNKRICSHCGGCGSKPAAERRHHVLYHFLSTCSGVSLLWDDPAACGLYRGIYQPDADDALLTDRLDYIMKTAGCNYKNILKGADRSAIFSEIAASVDRGVPVLMKLGGGADWHAVTGYDTERSALYGIDAHKHYCAQPEIRPDGYLEDGQFYLTGWYEPFEGAVIITDTDTVCLPFPELIRRMYRILSREENKELERDVLSAIDTERDLRKLARRLNALAGYTVECRWHAAECCGSILSLMTENPVRQEALEEIKAKYLQFHDLCWRIWELLGVGPAAAYALPERIGEMLQEEARRSSLKELFGALFELDRNVCGLLRHIAGCCKSI